MPTDLNFEAEPFGAFSGSHGESSEEFETVIRDHRGYVARPAGYGAVVRDHRGYGGTIVRPPVRYPGSAHAGRPWGGQGHWAGAGNWQGRGHWPGKGYGAGWGRGVWSGKGHWGGRGAGQWPPFGGHSGGWGRWGDRGYGGGWGGFGHWGSRRRLYWPAGGDTSDPGWSPGPQGGFAFAPPTADPQTVAWAQGCLAQVVGPWVPQDGALGPATLRAIRTFQAQAQLPATGALDDNTLAALQQACQPAAPPADAAAPAPQDGAPAAPPSDPSQSAQAAPSAPAQSEAFGFPYGFGGGSYEMETPRSGSGLIALKIPDAPYSDENFQRIHFAFDVVEAVHTALEVFGVELAGLLGLGVTALAPLAALVGNFFALGSGYAEGRAVISRQRVRSGFSLGVVMGADRRKWGYVKGMFWEYGPESNSFDQDAGKIAQTAFNTGLATGFAQGREIAKNAGKMSFFWHSIGASLTPGDRTEFGGDSKAWSDLTWRNWYITAGVRFGSLYLKN